MTRLLLVSLAFLVACANGGAGTLRGTDLGSEVDAPGPSAAAYSTRASAGGIIALGNEDAVREGIDRAAATHHATLVGDGRLAILAGQLAERIGSGATLPPVEVTRFFAYHLGLTELTPHVVLVGVPDVTTIDDAVADAVGQYLRRQRYDVFGAAVIRRQGIHLAVVALSARPYSISDVPRSFASPTTISVVGELADGFREPAFELVEPERGTVVRVAAGDDRSITASLEFTTRGEYEVRLLATSSAGRVPIARFPVYVGEEPPRVLHLGAVAPAPEGETAAQVETALLASIASMRSAEGLPPLERHDALSAVALAHSEDMVAHGFTSHVSPTNGSPTDRVRAANLSSGLVLENLGRGRDSRAIHEGLVASAQNRANVLNRDVTHVGIGVVAKTENGRTEFVVTEMFFRINQAIDVTTAPATLLDAINRARIARNAPAAEIDPNLSRAAAEAAQRYLAEPGSTDTDVLDAATGSLRRFAIAYRRVGGVLTVVSSLDEAATLEPTFDPTVVTLGIGVAQGTRPDVPPNSVVVVYLLAWSR